MPERSAALLAPLSVFVMEILPWALSGLIALYLVFSLCSVPQVPAGEKPVAARTTPAVSTTGLSALRFTTERT